MDHIDFTCRQLAKMPSDYDKADHRSAAEYLLAKRTKESISHRIIEKRRRDRINRCLNDLSRLVPATANRKGKLEKAEILQQAVEHLRQLQECRQHDQGPPKEIKKEKPDEFENVQNWSNGSGEFPGHLAQKENMQTRDLCWYTNVHHMQCCDATRTDPDHHSEQVKVTQPRVEDSRSRQMTSLSTSVDGSAANTDVVRVPAHKTRQDNEPTETARQMSKSNENLSAHRDSAGDKSWKLPLKKRDCVHSGMRKLEISDKIDNEVNDSEPKENSRGHANGHIQCSTEANEARNDGYSAKSSVVQSVNKLNSAMIIQVKPSPGEHCQAEDDNVSPASKGYTYVSSIHPALAAGVPIFALHPSGSGFVPLTVNPRQLASAIANSTEFAPVNDMALTQHLTTVPDIPIPVSNVTSPQQSQFPHAIEASQQNATLYSRPYYYSPLLSSALSTPASILGSNSSISSLSSLSSMASYSSISSRISAQPPWQGPPCSRPISH
ncbi:uncharacterized protein [Ptychodera flava]|uniref:uncharacterized protein isoform X2 n=1 Tax=Ptychodera flava TaxID=63121 RepID=UPI00396A4A63